MVFLLAACARFGYQEGNDLGITTPVDRGPGDTTTRDRMNPQEDSDLAGMVDQNLSWAHDGPPVDLTFPTDAPAQKDLPRHIDSAPDVSVLLSCPGEMVAVGDYCIDSSEGKLRSWVDAAVDCMTQGKRLCSQDEWTTACSSSLALSDITGNWEWIADLFSDTEAKKVGESTCGSLKQETVTSGLNATRCCLSRGANPSEMYFIGSTGPFIDHNQGLSQTWIKAVSDCMIQGKRLCNQQEWTSACSSGDLSMHDMIGDYEWLMTLVNATNAYKIGSSSCSALSNHSFSSGAYRTRCCF